MQSLEIAKELIARPSVSPDDKGCQEYLASLLEPMGFTCHRLQYGDVSNLWATRGSGAPLVTYLGHTDVVPSGEDSQWHTPPFEPRVIDGKLFGRGSADMKGSVACFVSALENFLAKNAQHKGTIGFLITSDEESIAIDGIKRVVNDYFKKNNIQIDHCLVGEPTSEEVLGDTIKNGRRGSLGARVTIFGKQGHIAYPHFARNPIHLASPLIEELTTKVWDKGNQDFEPTGFQISNINAGTGATNVIPAQLSFNMNFRYNTEHTDTELRTTVERMMQRHELEYQIDWKLSGGPYICPTDGALVRACKKTGLKVFGKEPALSTSGGISDGRFIAPTGAETVEFGGLSKTIHRTNECIGLDEIEGLTRSFEMILEELLCRNSMTG